MFHSSSRLLGGHGPPHWAKYMRVFQSPSGAYWNEVPRSVGIRNFAIAAVTGYVLYKTACSAVSKNIRVIRVGGPKSLQDDDANFLAKQE